ncbi:hypothetical protein DERF_013670 [Dermatophagoides farinae]|uniref:Uncharacterized protein n=1 Tax=Dermatophagoides farinae TaxID=6954 RepID=A0A922HMZ9_DERFA|nr:hypothetical protein DERF_013670 [Dermatophagoides farinae]
MKIKKKDAHECSYIVINRLICVINNRTSTNNNGDGEISNEPLIYPPTILEYFTLTQPKINYRYM